METHHLMQCGTRCDMCKSTEQLEARSDGAGSLRSKNSMTKRLTPSWSSNAQQYLLSKSSLKEAWLSASFEIPSRCIKLTFKSWFQASKLEVEAHYQWPTLLSEICNLLLSHKLSFPWHILKKKVMLRNWGIKCSLPTFGEKRAEGIHQHLVGVAYSETKRSTWDPPPHPRLKLDGDLVVGRGV